MRRFSGVVVLAVTVLSFILSTFVLFTPAPSADAAGFSAVQAAAHIAEISREPHSVFDPEAHETVRQYLKDAFSEYVGAANVTEMDYAAAVVDPDIDYDIRNLLAVIPGASPKGILIVAHYDSRGHIGRTGELGRSYGAADDGYGLAVLLEIARLYGERSLENTIYLLATDGEETGLYGAHMAAQEAFMDDVNFVVNVEARGVDGAAYMFETSGDNAALIDFYRAAELPVTYSIATAVYSVMPNYTDFTEFLAIDKTGINFAVLKGLTYYHTPHDEYINIDLSSIQHYGSQIVPVVEAFVTDARYADPDALASDQNAVFFTILPGWLVSYTETAGLVMTIVGFLLFALLVFVFARKQAARPIVVLRHAGYTLALVVIAGIVGLLLGKVIAFFGKVPYSLTYTRMEGTELPTAIIMAGCLADLYLLLRRFVKNEDHVAAMLGGILVNLVLALATGLTLSGASFLFFVPAAIGLLSLLVHAFVKNPIVRHVALGQNILWNMLLIVPLLYSLFLALTVGGLPALLVILVIDASVWLPSTRILVTA
ncbi:MAG: M28 family peptidase [Candidatus Izemoplasmatales bacterium]